MKRFGWHILFFTAFYFVLHFLQHYALGPEFVRYHFKDFLLVPMLMFSIGIVSELFGLKISLGNKEVLIAFLYCVLAFELIIPGVSENQKLDWLDIGAYAFGAVLYSLVYKQTSANKHFKNAQYQKE